MPLPLAIIYTTGRPDVLINADFSPFCNVYDSKRSMSESLANIQNLTVTVYHTDGGKRRHVHLDHFAPESNDHHFVRRVFLALSTRPELKHVFDAEGRRVGNVDWIELWTDGGPKHFKTRRTLTFVLVELKRRMPWIKRLTWAFYASHHGKSVNDAHSAVCKRIIWRVVLDGDRIEGPKMLAELVSNIKNTEATYFEFLDRDEAFDCSSIPGLRGHHFFEWTGKVDEEGKYEILMTKQYPTSDAEVDQGTKVYVQPFFSIDFDDRSGTSLDVSAKDQKQERAAMAETKRKERMQQRAEERLAELRSPGTTVCVRIRNEKGRNERWEGTVLRHGPGNDENPETIDVELSVTDLARKRGLVEPKVITVPLDVNVQLIK